MSIAYIYYIHIYICRLRRGYVNNESLSFKKYYVSSFILFVYTYTLGFYSFIYIYIYIYIHIATLRNFYKVMIVVV